MLPFSPLVFIPFKIKLLIAALIIGPIGLYLWSYRNKQRDIGRMEVLKDIDNKKYEKEKDLAEQMKETQLRNFKKRQKIEELKKELDKVDSMDGEERKELQKRLSELMFDLFGEE